MFSESPIWGVRFTHAASTSLRMAQCCSYASPTPASGHLTNGRPRAEPDYIERLVWILNSAFQVVHTWKYVQMSIISTNHAFDFCRFWQRYSIHILDVRGPQKSVSRTRACGLIDIDFRSDMEDVSFKEKETVVTLCLSWGAYEGLAWSNSGVTPSIVTNQPATICTRVSRVWADRDARQKPDSKCESLSIPSAWHVKSLWLYGVAY